MGAAAEGLALARELSVRAQRLEATDGAAQLPRIMPDAGVFVVADQLTVAAVDLVEALRTDPSQEELDEALGRAAGGSQSEAMTRSARM